MTYGIQFANQATSTLAAPITAAAVTATLAPGTGELFPQISAGQFFALTFISVATPVLSEIVYVTGLSGDTITAMTRSQEGTAAQAFLFGDAAQALITAGALQGIVTAVNAITTAPLPIQGYSANLLPAASQFLNGTQSFCTNGRNMGESAGNGTGCPVFVKTISGTKTWCAIWSGVAVTV